MRDKLKETFDQIHAEEELKENTLEFLAEKRRRDRKKRFPQSRRLVPVLACLAAVFLCLGGYRLYFTPTSIISIDINPSLELGINPFDRVVSVEGFNEDGKELAASLDLEYMSYTRAVEEILSDERIAAYLSEDQVLSIAVAGADEGKTETILSQVRACARGHKNTHCYGVSHEEITSAHEAGLSCGKYRAYLELKEYDPDITVEEVSGMTMKEIRDRIASLAGKEEAGESTSYRGKDSAQQKHGHGGQEHSEDDERHGHGYRQGKE